MLSKLSLTYKKLHIGAIFFLLLTASCQKQAEEPVPLTPTNPNSAINNYVWNVMREIYLWNDKMPQNIDPNKFETPEKLLDTLIYKSLDRFTNIRKDNGASANQILTGSSAGYGIRIGLEAQKNWRIVSVFPNSPASEAGLVRGMRIISVDGVATSPTQAPALSQNQSVGSTIEVEGLDGKVSLIKAIPRAYTQQPIIHREVRTVGNKKVAYLVYQSFIKASELALNEAFAFFKQQGANELVVDLRYNGGGEGEVMLGFASLIAPASATGRTFYRVEYNNKNSGRNALVPFKENMNKLNISKVIFITTGNTASASEVSINGLMPHIQVVTIGSRSFGKFVGSPILVEQGYSFSPIFQQTVNSRGEFPPNGIEPTFEAADDFTRAWGDEREPMFRAALHYAVNGSFAGLPTNGRVESTIASPLTYSTDNEVEGLYFVQK
jgi:C-terminal processing protease CtpA/Prc